MQQDSGVDTAYQDAGVDTQWWGGTAYQDARVETAQLGGGVTGVTEAYRDGGVMTACQGDRVVTAYRGSVVKFCYEIVLLRYMQLQ